MINRFSLMALGFLSWLASGADKPIPPFHYDCVVAKYGVGDASGASDTLAFPRRLASQTFVLEPPVGISTTRVHLRMDGMSTLIVLKKGGQVEMKVIDRTEKSRFRGLYEIADYKNSGLKEPPFDFRLSKKTSDSHDLIYSLSCR